MLYHYSSLKAELFISMNQTDNDKPTDFTAYQWLIKKLMYMAYKPWYNISFVIGLLSQYNFNPRVKHFHVIK